MRLGWLALSLALLVPGLRAQEPFARKNTFVAFAEYSNDSSHIILGTTPNRRLAGIGGLYERRLVTGRYVAFSYAAEFRPFVISADPFAQSSVSGTSTSMGVTTPFSYQTSGVVAKCVPGTTAFTFSDPAQGYTAQSTDTIVCSRQTTLAQAGSPLGLRVTLRPRSRLQVMLSTNGGYMFATKPIPIPTAGSFNFTFNFGGGLEYYTSTRRSVRIEYLVQHYSNKFTAQQNPGVDSGFIRVGYAFGR